MAEGEMGGVNVRAFVADAVGGEQFAPPTPRMLSPAPQNHQAVIDLPDFGLGFGISARFTSGGEIRPGSPPGFEQGVPEWIRIRKSA